MSIKLITELEIEECKRRIRSAADDSPLAIFKPCALAGKVGARTFWLQKRRLHFQNSFTRIFYGKFSRFNNKTIIEGSFKIHLFIKILMVIWFVMVIFAGVFIILGSISSSVNTGSMTPESNSILGLLALVVMMIFSIFIIRYGIKLSLEEERILIEYLLESLDAQKI